MLFPVVTSASWLIKGQSFSGYHIPCPLCFPGTSLCILHHHFNSLFSIPSFSILSYLLPYKNSYFVYIFWQPLFLSVCLFRGISQNCLYRQFPILISALYLITMPFTAYHFSLNYVLLDPRDSSLLSVYRSPSSTWPWLITSPLLWTVSSLFFCDYIFSSHLSAHSFFWRLLSSPNSKSEYFPAFCLFVLVSFFFFLAINSHYGCCSVAHSCPTLWDPAYYSMAGFPVLHFSRSLLKIMSIELMMASKPLILILIRWCQCSIFSLNLSELWFCMELSKSYLDSYCNLIRTSYLLNLNLFLAVFILSNCIRLVRIWFWAFPGGASGKEPACQCRRRKRWGFNPWVGKIPWRRAWQPIPVFLPGETHGQRILAGHSP